MKESTSNPEGKKLGRSVAPRELSSSHQLFWQYAGWNAEFEKSRKLLSNKLRRSIKLALVAFLMPGVVLLVISATLVVLGVGWPTMPDAGLVVVMLTILGISGSFIAVILAVVTFRFGTSETDIREARALLIPTLDDIQELREELRTWEPGARTDAPPEIQRKGQELGEASRKLNSALGRLHGRFSRTELDVPIDEGDLAILDLMIEHLASQWFLAAASLFHTTDDRESIRKTWKRVSSLKGAVYRANRQMVSAFEGKRQSFDILNSAVPILAVFVVASLTALAASIEAGSGMPDVLNPPSAAMTAGALAMSATYFVVRTWKWLNVHISQSEADRKWHQDRSKQLEREFQETDPSLILEAAQSQADAWQRINSKKVMDVE